MTATQTSPAGEFTFTVQAADMITALQGVSQFASTDTTLPVLCGVLIELDGGELTLVATDRYTLGYQTVKADKTGGSGQLFLPTAIVKAFIAQKASAKFDVWTFTADADNWTVDSMAGGKQTHPNTATRYPRWRPLIARFKPAPKTGRIDSITLHAKLLAKIAKVPGDGNVRFNFGAVNKPAKFTAGEVTGLIMPLRDVS